MATEKSHSTGRRKFLDTLLGISGLTLLGGLIYPLFRFLTPPEQEEAVVSSVNLGSANAIQPNSGQIFRFGNKPGILIRDKDGQFRAYYATCTHLDCTVQYEAESESIWCACHNGRYDLSGVNISGPPPRPLPKLQVNLLPQSNELVITIPAGDSHDS